MYNFFILLCDLGTSTMKQEQDNTAIFSL